MIFSLLASAFALDVFLRGCPGMGTRWAEKALPCLFEGKVQIHSRGKHDGCRIDNVNTLDPSELLVPECHTDCVHAVLARHPLSLKNGSAVPQWEAYYGAWMHHAKKNVVFLRLETLLTTGCTREKDVHPDVLRRVEEMASVAHVATNRSVWKFWNYTAAEEEEERDATTCS